MSSRARAGRRPGSGATRARILAAARTSFGELGFDATTIRGVAGRAEVDSALVHHYFGSKQQLFVAAMDFPVELPSVIPGLLAGPPDELGRRIAAYALDLWETPGTRPLMLGLLRSATTDEVAAGMLRDMLAQGPFAAMARAANQPDADLRATLVGSQLVGLAMARYIVRAEPLASAPREVVVDALGPTLQRYLEGELA
jgi:AcrR family transcriptional regulator